MAEDEQRFRERGKRLVGDPEIVQQQVFNQLSCEHEASWYTLFETGHIIGLVVRLHRFLQHKYC